MEITLKSASTTRTVELSVAGVEPMQRQYSSRIFRPDLLTIIYRDGVVDEVRVSGPRVLKDRDSDLERGDCSWYSALAVERYAPEWIRHTVASSTPHGDAR